MNLVFWLNIISPHQASYIRALASRPDCHVTVVAEQAMNYERASLGWEIPSLGEAKVIVLANEDLTQIVNECDLTAIHILGGIRGSALVSRILRILCKRRLRLGVISEAPNTAGYSGAIRRLIYSVLALRYSRHINFILAIGKDAPRFFRSCGFHSDTIFPFVYVTSSVEHTPGLTPNVMQEDTIKIGYVGQLINRKGVDLLLRAAAIMRSKYYKIIIIGDGKLRKCLMRLTDHLGLSAQVEYYGAVSNQQARSILSQCDFMVLPSRFDGWGAVINESLMSGVPVLCSDRCGARSLLGQPWRGTVFEAGNVDSLAMVLKMWIETGKRSPGERSRIIDWTKCIEGEAVCRYLTDLLTYVYEQGDQPFEPWQTSRS